MLYRNLSGYFREKYGTRLKKICIDGGFSCPNRDGKCGTGGCIFCGERGSGEHIDPMSSIREQVEAELARGEENDRFIAYFQNYTNTYADTDTLKERYDAALFDKRITVLAIGTRPDCIDDGIAALIASYKDRVDVWVELGLQSSNDKTGELINRGYKTEAFEEAVKTLKRHGIDIVAHMIIGLPGEGKEDAVKTAEFIARCGVFGIKIHSIYVMEGTALAELYRKKLYTPPTLEEYIDTAADVISTIPDSIVIHRITGDCPRDLLIAPMWNKDKNTVIEGINRVLKERGERQGSRS